MGSIEHVVGETVGVCSDELRAVLDETSAGAGVSDSLLKAARRSHHHDAARLYQILSHAHRSGARLVDALEIFSADRRSSIARDMIEEGGRRAIAGYGPILGLMIPTTLAFLLYPTLAGLDALATTR
jgi:tight adherence protein C